LTPRLHTKTPLRAMAAAAAVLSSLPFDWALRLRLGGTNLNGFVLADCVLPRLDAADETGLARLALQLAAILPWHTALWEQAAAEGWGLGTPATDPEHRRQLTTCIDVLVGDAYGLRADDVAWITRACDQPIAALRRRGQAPGPAKGFWRVDRDLAPPMRQPNRWLAAVTGR
jgi:hypothetical protein